MQILLITNLDTGGLGSLNEALSYHKKDKSVQRYGLLALKVRIYQFWFSARYTWRLSNHTEFRFFSIIARAVHEFDSHNFDLISCNTSKIISGHAHACFQMTRRSGSHEENRKVWAYLHTQEDRKLGHLFPTTMSRPESLKHIRTRWYECQQGQCGRMVGT